MRQGEGLGTDEESYVGPFSILSIDTKGVIGSITQPQTVGKT